MVLQIPGRGSRARTRDLRFWRPTKLLTSICLQRHNSTFENRCARICARDSWLFPLCSAFSRIRHTIDHGQADGVGTGVCFVPSPHSSSGSSRLRRTCSGVSNCSGCARASSMAGTTSSRSQRFMAASRATSVRRPSRMTSLSLAYSPEDAFFFTICAISSGRMIVRGWVVRFAVLLVTPYSTEYDLIIHIPDNPIPLYPEDPTVSLHRSPRTSDLHHTIRISFNAFWPTDRALRSAVPKSSLLSGCHNASHAAAGRSDGTKVTTP